jgi:uncharacterized NAD(P)/FAD-binding protein YdhS
LTARHVAIVGGGYAGTLQAIELSRRGFAVTLIERGPQVGRGVAYGTAAPEHLLNVRAAGMSAFADASDHFADWLKASGEGDRDSFAPRRTYGRYLGELLDAAVSEGVRIERAEAIDVEEPATVRLASGSAVEADVVILAVGNLPPERPRLIPAALEASVYLSDPWSAELTRDLAPDARVLLIGTGLTAIDAALSLDSAGHHGPILALSRRGLLPRAHTERAVQPPALTAPPAPDPIALLRWTRAEADRLGWRPVVDSLRPVTQAIWAKIEPLERHRFLRHLRPWWDVHRHRIAPSIAAHIDGMRQAGRLRLAAGKLLSVAPAPDGTAEIAWRPRGQAEAETFRAARIVNCTGPQTDLTRANEPLLDALLARGRIRPDACRTGIDVAADCRILDRSGRPSDHLFAVGPITRSAFWEIVAVPDIRVQVRDLAERLAVSTAAPNRASRVNSSPTI